LGVKRNNRTQELLLSNAPSLFRMDLGRTVPVDSMRIIGNEKIAFHVDSSGGIDFLETELNPTGASSDRYSPAATWDVTFTRSELKEKLRSLADSIGEFVDLKPARFGKSGRVIQVEIVGSRRAVVLNGYNVRGTLGLKDTLYTITREINPDGSIASFTFHGRGFGHGIGLCQTGAFGMARAGRSYEEILKHYYQGVEIRKAY
jgi:stage II sporulation protein D